MVVSGIGIIRREGRFRHRSVICRIGIIMTVQANTHTSVVVVLPQTRPCPVGVGWILGVVVFSSTVATHAADGLQTGATTGRIEDYWKIVIIVVTSGAITTKHGAAMQIMQISPVLTINS